ncbi:hypothetical protein ANN_14558 [Periplaneta americana]|uniref:Reverse transcriptase domain-containing protein n=1 Tax=Periplaneta americana TaxID=6978 RepID=A0ABQ8SWN9_PERAM|nr:hypothetical protein ANN_14558 [Periplaneta americana]
MADVMCIGSGTILSCTSNMLTNWALHIYDTRKNSGASCTDDDERCTPAMYWKGKGTRDAIGLLRTIGERYLEKNKEVHVVFVDLKTAFDRVDWNKLMRILKKIGVDWKERRLFSNLYIMKRVKVRTGEEMSERSELGEEYVKDVLYHLPCSTSTWRI